MVLAEAGRRAELPLAERKALVIASVREILLPLPDTTISFQVKSPQATTLTHEFTNSDGDVCRVVSSPDSLDARKKFKSTGTVDEFLSITPTHLNYTRWPSEEFPFERNSGMNKIEERIGTFLPPAEAGL